MEEKTGGVKVGMKKERKLKVYGMSGYSSVNVPTIVLKGKWLEQLGFGIDTPIVIKCEEERLTIIKGVVEKNKN